MTDRVVTESSAACETRLPEASRNGRGRGERAGGCRPCRRINCPGRPSSRDAAVSMFSLRGPTLPGEKAPGRRPALCSHTRLPSVYLCLLLYGLYRRVCLIPLVCTHPLREEKEGSIANLLKGKRDSHCFFFLWRALFENRMLTLCVPEKNDFFVNFKF